MGKRRVVFYLAIVAILILTLLGSGQALLAEDEVTDLPGVELPPKGHPKLDSPLDQLVRANKEADVDSFAQQRKIKLAVGRVRVVIECLPEQVNATIDKAIALGADVERNYHNLIQVVAPITCLTALAETPSTRLVRMPYYGYPCIISEGVELINADDWKAAGYTGAGVKIAILDGGFTGYNTLLGTELPPSVTTQSFYSGGNINGDTSHGTACAEIVFDVAPDAEFYLVNFNTALDLLFAVDYLIAQDVDIISFSYGYPTGGPGDGTGMIDEIVDVARANGILWVSSMGNYAQRHWQGDFVNIDADQYHEFNQDPRDEGNSIDVIAGQSISVGLKWDDPWGASGNDYDLLLFNHNGERVAYSMNTQDGNDYPVEQLDYTATYTGRYGIGIGTLGSPQVVNFHLYSPTHNLQFQVPSSSLGIPADSPNAMSVGAVFWNTSTTLESFSSRGPTKDGRIKPDLVAPDGVSTTYNSSNGAPEAQGGTGFFGTSASAPHAAGAAALVKQRYQSYTPAQIQDYLETNAIDLGSAGKDNLFGSGSLYMGPLPPTADFTGNTTSGDAPLTVQFTDQSTGTISSWLWDFGDGNTSIQQNPSHEYTTAGAFTVSLTVTGPVGTDTKTINDYITVSPGPLDHVVASPDQAFIQTEATQQFTAAAYDQYDNPITGLSFTWNVVNSGGSIDQDGLFTAGTTRGTFSSTIQAETTHNSITKQGTATVIIGAAITVTATLEGGQRPTAGYDVPLTLKLYDQATTLTVNNILTETSLYTFTKSDGAIIITNTNTSTKAITLQVTGLPVGTFNITLFTPHALINLRNSQAIAASGTSFDMGTLLEGNADDSEQITGADFSLLLDDYLQIDSGDEWHGGRCDFDYSGQVNSIDFSLLIAHYNGTSPQTVE